MVSWPGAEDEEHFGGIWLGRRGSTSLYGLRIEGTSARGLRGKRLSSKALFTSSGEVALGKLGKRGVTLLTGNLFVVHIVLRVASAKKDFQTRALAALMDLKDPCLERIATALSWGSFDARAFPEDVWNSFLRVESSGDHHGLALIEGRRSCVWVFRSVASAGRCELNWFSIVDVVGSSAGGGTFAVVS